MLHIKEMNVRGKRKAIVISCDPGDIDGAALLEVIWDALGEYETERRRIRGIRVRWTLTRMNDEFSDIVLVYPCLFTDHDTEVKEKAIRRRKKKKAPQTSSHT